MPSAVTIGTVSCNEIAPPRSSTISMIAYHCAAPGEGWVKVRVKVRVEVRVKVGLGLGFGVRLS